MFWDFVNAIDFSHGATFVLGGIAGAGIGQLVQRAFRRVGKTVVQGTLNTIDNDNGKIGGVHYTADVLIRNCSDEPRSIHRLRFRFKAKRKTVCELRLRKQSRAGVRQELQIKNIELPPHQAISLGVVGQRFDDGQLEVKETDLFAIFEKATDLFLVATDVASGVEVEWHLAGNLNQRFSGLREKYCQKAEAKPPPAH